MRMLDKQVFSETKKPPHSLLTKMLVDNPTPCICTNIGYIQL
jgi:hypothetical protein